MKKATIPEEKRSQSQGNITTGKTPGKIATIIQQANQRNARTSSLPLIHSKGEARADSRILAAQLGNHHENTYDLVKRYEADFLELGILRFETGEIAGRGQPEKYVLLNEDQSYLLLTYSRNTPKVRALKIKLIKAFREARYGHAFQTLEARKQEASHSGSRLAHWRYDKPGMYQHVTHLREQLKLPIEQEDMFP